MKSSDWIIIIGLFSCLILLIYIAVIAKSDGVMCLKKPFEFGAEKLYESNGAEPFCSCSFKSGNGVRWTFDRHNLTLEYYKNLLNSNEITNISYIERYFNTDD